MLSDDCCDTCLIIVEDDPILAQDLRASRTVLGADGCIVTTTGARDVEVPGGARSAVAMMERSALPESGGGTEKIPELLTRLRRSGVPVLFPSLYRHPERLRGLTRVVPGTLIEREPEGAEVDPGIAAAVGSHRVPPSDRSPADAPPRAQPGAEVRGGVALVVARTGEIEYASPTAALVLEHSVDDLHRAGLGEFVHQGDRAPFLEDVAQVADAGDPREGIRLRLRSRSGRCRELSLNLHRTSSGHGVIAFARPDEQRMEIRAPLPEDPASSPALTVGVREIGRRAPAEDSSARPAGLADTSRNAIVGKGRDGSITGGRRGARSIHRWGPEEAEGPEMSQIGACAVDRDVTESKRMEPGLGRLAFEDSMTGLSNRRAVEEHAARIFALADRRGHGVGVVHLDLVGFKRINETLGRAAGDRVLVEVARRLNEEARDSDVVARLGGDEFMVLLSEIEDSEGAISLTRRLAERLEEPLETEVGVLSVRARFGIALYPDHGSSIQELISAADHAMDSLHDDRADRRVRVFERGSKPDEERYPPLEMQLGRALGDDELRLHYQPIFRISDLSVVGGEALVRWKHPERGLLGAEEFIEQVERTGRAPELDVWVLRRVLDHHQAIQADPEDRSADRSWRAVNLSGATLGSEEAIGRIEELLMMSPAAASNIVLEVTEQSTVERPVVAAERLRRLRATGARIALDDFGTGHSSLAYLEQLPVDQLKLDRLFLRQLERRIGPDNLAGKIIELGHALDLEVVLEGIERESLFEWATGDRADFMQRFYLGRPVPGDSWTDISRHFSKSAWSDQTAESERGRYPGGATAAPAESPDLRA